MIAIIGLGNPGDQYANTKHNAGFWVADEWAQRHHLSFEPGKGDYVLAQHKRREVIVVKPTTGMNQSGSAVKDVALLWDLSPSEIYAIVDDVDLPLGTIRIRPKGGDGCHRAAYASVLQHHLHGGVAEQVRLQSPCRLHRMLLGDALDVLAVQVKLSMVAERNPPLFAFT